MFTNHILKHALINAALTALYVIVVGTFLFYASQVFGPAKTVLVPIAMLLLLVVSAGITGSLFFGRPILWYLEGKKKEAISLLTSTLLVFMVITLTAFLILLVRT